MLGYYKCIFKRSYYIKTQWWVWYLGENQRGILTLNQNSIISFKFDKIIKTSLLSVGDKCQRKACAWQREDLIAVTGNNIFQVAWE